LVKTLFPAAQIATINASHWVQAEKPEEFVQVVLKFLKN
jgi:pimeloyl-ACP methyl ester carboxylesterase